MKRFAPKILLQQLAQQPSIGILGIAFGIWVLGFFLITPLFQDVGYWAFLLWKMGSPAMITLFLYVRSIRHAESRNNKLQLHVAWLATLMTVVLLGAWTLVGYDAMDDAPRGWLWDIYQFAALWFGTAAFWIFYACGLLFTWRKDEEPH